MLQTELFEQELSSAVATVLARCQTAAKQNLLISATGAHGLVMARQDEEFRCVLQSFFLNLPDGMPGVWVGRLKGARAMQRCYGPDFFAQVMLASRALPIRHFFCGGQEGVAEALREVCRARFGNANVVGVYSPPFRELSEAELQELAETINCLNTDILWIGLSTPKQEVFAWRLARYTQVHFLCTVGAAFDFHTGRAPQAPPWMQRAGLEWLFRLLSEPRRLWRRYAKVVPLFIFYNLLEILQGKFYLSSSIEGGKS